MTRESSERGKRLRGDLEQLGSRQEQTLGTLDTRMDAMLERRTQAIMERLDGLLANRSGIRNRGSHSREASREPRVNFNERPKRGRTYRSTKRRGNSSSNDTGINFVNTSKSLFWPDVIILAETDLVKTPDQNESDNNRVCRL